MIHKDLTIDVSILMSVYNNQAFICKAIDSILNQSYKYFECIIIDDGSTDGTSDILKQYLKKDNRISVITNNKNIGLTKSLNKGLLICKGKYIARLDADDISVQDRIKIQYDYLEKNNHIAACGSQGICIDDKDNVLGEKNLPISYKEIKHRLLFNNQFIHSSLFIKKSVLDKVGLYNELFKTSQDYELMLRIAENHNVTNLRQALVKWRVHNNSISWTTKKQEIDAIRARWFAITKYNYSKIRGIILILIRIVWLFIPLSIKKKRYA